MGREGLDRKIKATSIIKTKNWKTASVDEDMEKLDPPPTAGGNVKYSAAVENGVPVPQEVKT